MQRTSSPALSSPGGVLCSICAAGAASVKLPCCLVAAGGDLSRFTKQIAAAQAYMCVRIARLLSGKPESGV